MHTRNDFPDIAPKGDERSQKKEQNTPDKSKQPAQKSYCQAADRIMIDHPADDNAKDDKIAETTGAFH